MNRRRSKKFDWSQFAIYIVLILFTLSFIIPFLQVVSSSFTSQADMMKYGGVRLIPKNIDLSGYQALLSSPTIFKAGFISVMRTLIGTALSLFVTAMLAFGLSRERLAGRTLFIVLIFITMIFGGGLIPTYMVVNALQLTNSFWSMILPGLVGVYYFILTKTFFQNIPKELEEAATIDGANPMQYFMRIALPVSKPMLATIGLFYAVGHWNAWFDAAIYINDYSKMPLQVVLKDIIVKFTDSSLNLSLSMATREKPPGVALRSALMIITTLPIICVYPFLQKYFVKGTMIGSIK